MLIVIMVYFIIKNFCGRGYYSFVRKVNFIVFFFLLLSDVVVFIIRGVYIIGSVYNKVFYCEYIDGIYNMEMDYL